MRLLLPWDTTAPKVARDALALWGANAEADVVVSELVTNAVLHGAPPILLLALRTPDVVHIEVADGSPHIGEAKLDSVGLRIVEAFSSVWGASRRDDGKVMWAEFPL